MDEPTASLDFGNQVMVLSEIRRLASRGLKHSAGHPDGVRHFSAAGQAIR